MTFSSSFSSSSTFSNASSLSLVLEFVGVKKHDTHASAPVGGNTDLCTTKLIYMILIINMCVCVFRATNENDEEFDI